MTGDEWAAEEQRAMLAASRVPVCAPDCPCKQDQAFDTPLDLEDTE